jgi:hypothetical protein
MYFDYVRDWWPLRHAPNVLLLHYADLKKDLQVRASEARARAPRTPP